MTIHKPHGKCVQLAQYTRYCLFCVSCNSRQMSECGSVTPAVVVVQRAEEHLEASDHVEAITCASSPQIQTLAPLHHNTRREGIAIPVNKACLPTVHNAVHLQT